MPGMVEDAWPVLARDAMYASVLAAQQACGGPVTALEARFCAVRAGRQLARNARAFSDLAEKVAALGPDQEGRSLHQVGLTREGRRLWWVKTTEAPSGDSA